MATLASAQLSDEERRVIELWLERLQAALDVEAVWLFGSRARGDAGPESDVDLLVITRGDPRRDRDHVWKLLWDVAAELGSNPGFFVPHTWDRAWLENRREIRSFFIREVDRDKIVLFGEP